MKYTILSINDDRAVYKNKIHELIAYDYLEVPCFNAYEQDPLVELEQRGLKLLREPHWLPKRGELGVWLSNLNAWQACVDSNQPLIVFEDDAVIMDTFMDDLLPYLDEIPANWGFMALWVPQDQLQDWYYNVSFDEYGFPSVNGYVRRPERSKFKINSSILSKVYQGYGGVAVMYSPRGAQQLLDCVQEWGLRAPCDCFIYLAAHAGKVDGYARHPDTQHLVYYDWSQPTTIHHSERV